MTDDDLRDFEHRVTTIASRQLLVAAEVAALRAEVDGFYKTLATIAKTLTALTKPTDRR